MNQADHIQALRDAASLRAGLMSHVMAHPEAPALAESDSKILYSLAVAYGQGRVPVTAGDDAFFAAGLQSSDFGYSLANVLRVATVNRLTAHAKHRAICAMREVPNFRAVHFPNVDVDAALGLILEGGSAKSEIALDDMAGSYAGLKTYGTNIFVSRQAVINDDIGLMAGLFANVGAAAARKEAALAYGLLEANPDLGDSAPLFHADFHNVVADVLNEANLATALGRLHTMTNGAGALADLDAAHLVVSPELKYSGNKLLKDAGLNEQISVIASPWLAVGRWYLSADPEQAPVVGLLHLEGSQGGIVVEPTAKPKSFPRDGVLLGVRQDVGVAPLGRVGIVRGGA